MTTPLPVPRPSANGWRLEHSYARLPEVLHVAWMATPVQEPRLVVFNKPLAAALGLDADALAQPENAGLFAGNNPPEGAAPIAQAYAGHQFGGFTVLGDGRALLLGEQITPAGTRFDIQLKGSGPTPFSRGGDGRAALGPMLREYVISEAMHALRIPTTRSLAVTATGQPVFRKETLPGAVLTRVAASHIRVGTFEWVAARRDAQALEALTLHTLQRHYPERAASDTPALELLRAVLEAQASLIARWMLTGFVHGVMNTDNMALSGETIDYGPCAFLDRYNPDTTFSSIDRNGRYAFANQPAVAQWNLARLAESLLPLIDSDETRALDAATALIHAFPARYEHHHRAGLRAKLGLFHEDSGDHQLAQSLLDWMTLASADHTNTFRALSFEQAFREPPFADPVFHEWHARWKARLALQSQSATDSLLHMQAHNPVVIPRNHLVEEALTAASDHADLAPLERLLAAIANPFDHSALPPAPFLEPAPPEAPPYRTFCGT
jgi:uncharacterized protein YdiU (UPF0061 family)